jgi:hypothetical protein
MALTVKIRADASHFKKTIAGVEVQASGLTGVIGKLATSNVAMGAAMAAAAAGAIALGAGLAFIKDASTKAAGIESLTMQFETLLGSAGKAKERMEEIKKFAASTPFEVANLSETSKLLQTLGGDLLATGAGLRMVGDAAALAGQPIQEVGLHVGRLFNAITSGTSAGEAVARLQELGLITGQSKLKFEALAAAQKKGDVATLSGAQALTLLQGVMSKTSGAMERLSTTTEGMKSNFQDAVDNLKVSFGTGFNEGLKSALDATNTFLPQLEGKFANAGTRLGVALSKSARGNNSAFVEIGILIGEAVALGFQDVAGNIIVDSLRAAMMATAGSQQHEQDKMRALTDKLFGPKVGIQERAMDLADTLKKKAKPVLDETEPDSWAKILERQIEQTDRQIALQKEANTKLEKIANGSPKPLTSR